MASPGFYRHGAYPVEGQAEGSVSGWHASGATAGVSSTLHGEQPRRLDGRLLGERERSGPAEVETLSIAHTEPTQHRLLTEGLDALGDDLSADLGGERHQRAGQGPAGGVGVYALHQRAVEFDDVRLEIEDVLQGGEPGAGVV